MPVTGSAVKVAWRQENDTYLHWYSQLNVQGNERFSQERCREGTGMVKPSMRLSLIPSIEMHLLIIFNSTI